MLICVVQSKVTSLDAVCKINSFTRPNAFSFIMRNVNQSDSYLFLKRLLYVIRCASLTGNYTMQYFELHGI